jgi:hypothetical protein
MAASGYTPISLYYSSTTGAAPSAANLVLGELALNIPDGVLYYRDAANVIRVVTDPNAVTLNATQTLTNKRITPRIGSNGATTSGNITPTGDLSDQYNITGLTGAITIFPPSGTPTNGQKLTIRIKDNGTGRTISWITTAGGYRQIGTTLPNNTVASKTTYVACIYNSADTYWDVVAVTQEV